MSEPPPLPESPTSPSLLAPLRPTAIDRKSEEVQDVRITICNQPATPALLLVHNHAFKPITGDTSKMPTVFLFLRHAEAAHNVKGVGDDEILDPPLTPAGILQCRTKAQAAMMNGSDKRMLSITHIVASPMRRTLQTALLYFKPLLSKNPDMRIIALPELKERGLSRSSTGTDIDILKEEFKHDPIDFSRVEKGWEKENLTILTAKHNQRARRVREALAHIGEDPGHRTGVGKYIAVVSHGGILQHITETEDRTRWSNCGFQEFRFSAPYIFDPPAVDTNFSMEPLQEFTDAATKKFKTYLKDVLHDPENKGGREFAHFLV